jgi:hypothetical protein
MSQSRVERLVRQLQGKPVPKKPLNENDAAAKAAEDRALSDADLERVTGGAGEGFGRARR